MTTTNASHFSLQRQPLSLFRSLFPLLLLPVALTFTGCGISSNPVAVPEAGAKLTGSVHGGQQPVAGARVYLLAASNAGYGSASTSLLTSGLDGTDAIGGYVLTDAYGGFAISGDYSCTQGQQVYVLALGGDPGAGPNAASAMISAVGSCPAAGNFAGTVPYINVNEVTTVAFAYAVSGFATDALHVASSGTALAQVGMSNAFASTANLLNGATTPAGNGTVPVAEINSLANILASCINSTGVITGPANPTACYRLLSNTMEGAVMPAETATAAMNIAHHPMANVATLFNLQPTLAPFVPNLSAAPSDFTVSIRYTGGGMVGSTAETNETANTINSLAVDASGNIWKPNYGGNSLTELSPLGAPISGSGGFTGGGLNKPQNVAIGLDGSVWTPNIGSSTLSKFTSGGSPATGSPFGAGILNGPQNLAIDAQGSVWVTNAAMLAKFSSAGVNASGSPFATNTLNAPYGIAVQPSGNVWVSNAYANTIAMYTSAGAAVSGSPLTQGGLAYPYVIAFDAGGYGWIAEQSSVTRLSASGANTSGSPFASPPGTIPTSLAVDGAGNVWVTDVAENAILELNSAGSYVSGTPGFQATQTSIPAAIVVDGSGNVWYTSYNDATIHELVGAGTPVVTPLAYGVKNNLLGTRP